MKTILLKLISITATLSILSISVQAKEIGVMWRATKTTIDGVKAKSGDTFKVGQEIKTGKSKRSKAELTTSDNSRFLIYKDSSIIVDELIMTDSGACSSMKVSMTQGKIRSTSGACGSGKTEIQTTAGAAFAWGTDYELVLIPEDNQTSETKPGFYQMVNEGKVFVESDLGSILINPGESGFVSPTEPPMIIPTSEFSKASKVIETVKPENEDQSEDEKKSEIDTIRQRKKTRKRHRVR